MKTADFSFELPDDLIARYPLEQRSASRMLCLNKQSGSIADAMFSEFAEQLSPGDLLVFNNTEVIPARLWGQKQTGGKLECLIERQLHNNQVLAHLRSSKSPPPGSSIQLGTDKGDGFSAKVVGRDHALFVLQFPAEPNELLQQFGHMPLPPYMQRDDELSDKQRYQTVYAANPGAVAAPTAGLHFDELMFQQLEQKGVEKVELTLHVGAGTFQPVRVDDVNEHQMHSEWMELGQQVCEKIEKTKAAGNRVVAVGTTSVRALESAARDGKLKPYTGDTDIFIYPGFEFKVVDALLTNFHLPESTLLMLVSALAGKDNVLEAYKHAVADRYRFYSYGDCMFIA